MKKDIAQKVINLAGSDETKMKHVYILFPFMNSRDSLIEVCAVNVGRLHIEANELIPNDDSEFFDEEKYDELMKQRDFYLEIIKSI